MYFLKTSSFCLSVDLPGIKPLNKSLEERKKRLKIAISHVFDELMGKG